MLFEPCLVPGMRRTGCTPIYHQLTIPTILSSQKRGGGVVGGGIMQKGTRAGTSGVHTRIKKHLTHRRRERARAGLNPLVPVNRRGAFKRQSRDVHALVVRRVDAEFRQATWVIVVVLGNHELKVAIVALCVNAFPLEDERHEGGEPPLAFVDVAHGVFFAGSSPRFAGHWPQCAHAPQLRSQRLAMHCNTIRCSSISCPKENRASTPLSIAGVIGHCLLAGGLGDRNAWAL